MTNARDELIEKIKLNLRFTNDNFDDEIADKVDEVYEDMIRLGIDSYVLDYTAKGRAAAVAYCRSEYAADPADRAAFYESYQSILDELRRSALYAANE